MIYRDIPRIDPQAIDSLKPFCVADLADALPAAIRDSGLMRRSIRIVTPGLRICGQAVTGFCALGDGLISHTALYVAKAGDVLVLSGGDAAQPALWGGNAALDAKTQGISGLVVDGAVRDVATLRALQFPTWSESVSPARAGKKGEGWVNKPIACGGVLVNPGDIVVGDDDGVLVFAPAHIETLVAEVRRKLELEAAIHSRMKQGERLFDIMRFGDQIEIKDRGWKA